MQIALIACSWVILGPFVSMAQEADLIPAADLDAVSIDISIQLIEEAYKIVEGDAVAKRQDDAPESGEAGEKPAEVDIDPRIAALEEQFRPHVKRLVQVELQFLRAVCRPSAQEFRNVKKGAQAAGAEVLKSLVDQQGPRGQAVRFNGFVLGRRPRVQKDLQESFRDAIAEIAKANLSAEAVDRYQREREMRIEARKTAGVLSLVAALDERLYLSETQRAQLQKELEKGWQDKWQSAQALMVNNPGYFPTVPDALVVPQLTSSQVEVWQGLQKVDYGINSWMAFGNAFGIDDEGLVEVVEEEEEEEEEPAVRAEVQDDDSQ